MNSFFLPLWVNFTDIKDRPFQFGMYSILEQTLNQIGTNVVSSQGDPYAFVINRKAYRNNASREYPPMYVQVNGIQGRNVTLTIGFDEAYTRAVTDLPLARVGFLQTYSALRYAWRTDHGGQIITAADMAPFVGKERLSEILKRCPANYPPEELDRSLFGHLIALFTGLDIRTEETNTLLWTSFMTEPHTVLFPALKLAQPGIIKKFFSAQP